MSDAVNPEAKQVNEKLKKHRVDHLLLLVGKNPVPNAVAGRLLTNPYGKISLIYTSDTADIATKLQQWLLDYEFQPELQKVKAANPSLIILGVREQLKKYKNLTIGLNYTGGTKAMSVHAFRAVEWWANTSDGKPIKAVFSYLDAPTLHLLFDPADPEGTSNVEAVYVGDALELKLEELLKLHGWTLGKAPLRTAALPLTSKSLAKAFGDEKKSREWIGWKGKILDKRGKLKDSWRGKTDTIPLPPASLQTISETLLSELDQTSESTINLDEAITKKRISNIDFFCEWIDGKWLEHCVLAILHNLSAPLNLHSCAQNIVPREVVFDLDVVAIRGYQLFAFSCSTDTEQSKGDRSQIKKKLFEAYIRARQLGGDEACVALISCSKDPESLEKEMRRDYDLEGRIKVFGRKHFNDLSNNIQKWIKSQSGVGN